MPTGKGSEEKAFHSGFCAVVGRPNVGKSTFLNRVIGQKVTIVSDKPQTTRNKIQCVWTTENAQIIFLDTPGIHKPYDRLGEWMVEKALEALDEVDAVLFMVDGEAGPGRGDREVAAILARVSSPVLLVVNKMDLVRRGERELAVERFSELGSYAGMFPISAATGEGMAELLEALIQRLPEGPKYYPDDWISDHPEQFVVAELIREKALMFTREEVPYAIAVAVEGMAKRPDRDLIDISATIYVERESQKGIVIGKGGSRLKEIGTLARQEIEALLGSPVNLKLWVKVNPDWRDKERALRALGYS
ncbi:MAG: GTPase Era [Clostridia bacterium]|nr:GTPase Era [Bacillota bacterium]MBO2520642.1 GTPase Era [Bacillota bacterium]